MSQADMLDNNVLKGRILHAAGLQTPACQGSGDMKQGAVGKYQLHPIYDREFLYTMAYIVKCSYFPEAPCLFERDIK